MPQIFKKLQSQRVLATKGRDFEEGQTAGPSFELTDC